MFIVSTNGITNVNQVSSIYVHKQSIMALTPKFNFPIYWSKHAEQLDYVYRKIVEHIIDNKNCNINDIVQEYVSQNGK